MSNERQLADVVMADQEWSKATRDMLRTGNELTETAGYYGRCLALAVVLSTHDIGVEELREQAVWANDLDREAVEKAEQGGDFADADYLEALARRVAHHSLRHAMGLVKSRHRREKLWYGSIYTDDRAPQRADLPGLGRMELKDMAEE